ncbi:hypothetical protein, partial [Salmonella sp. s60131]|uniref:hypothetical protein n=1 Tax=Salmonella sp. s60131 TaxID=3159722 RepID=UPI003980CE35
RNKESMGGSGSGGLTSHFAKNETQKVWRFILLQQNGITELNHEQNYKLAQCFGFFWFIVCFMSQRYQKSS